MELNQSKVAPLLAKERGPFSLLQIGAIAAWLSLALIPIQVAIFAIWPPPTAIVDWFALLDQSWLLGLVSIDLLYMFNNFFLILIYLALYQALKSVNPEMMLIALVLGLIGIAVYYASNPAFEMLLLSNKYGQASDMGQQQILLAAGEAVMSRYIGTAFNTYYVLSAITLLMMAGIMGKSPHFSAWTFRWGIAAGVLMIVPSTVGILGLVFSLLSLIPWIGFCIFAAKDLFRMAGKLAYTEFSEGDV